MISIKVDWKTRILIILLIISILVFDMVLVQTLIRLNKSDYYINYDSKRAIDIINNRNTGLDLKYGQVYLSTHIRSRLQEVVFGQLLLPSQNIETKLVELAETDKRWIKTTVNQDGIRDYCYSIRGTLPSGGINSFDLIYYIDGGDYDWVFYDIYYPTFVFIDTDSRYFAIYTGDWE